MFSPGMAVPVPGSYLSHDWPCFHLVTLTTWPHLAEPGGGIQPIQGQWDFLSPGIE